MSPLNKMSQMSVDTVPDRLEQRVKKVCHAMATHITAVSPHGYATPPSSHPPPTLAPFPRIRTSPRDYPGTPLGEDRFPARIGTPNTERVSTSDRGKQNMHRVGGWVSATP